MAAIVDVALEAAISSSSNLSSSSSSHSKQSNSLSHSKPSPSHCLIIEGRRSLASLCRHRQGEREVREEVRGGGGREQETGRKSRKGIKARVFWVFIWGAWVGSGCIGSDFLKPNATRMPPKPIKTDRFGLGRVGSDQALFIWAFYTAVGNFTLYTLAHCVQGIVHHTCSAATTYLP